MWSVKAGSENRCQELHGSVEERLWEEEGWGNYVKTLQQSCVLVQIVKTNGENVAIGKAKKLGRFFFLQLP